MALLPSQTKEVERLTDIHLPIFEDWKDYVNRGEYDKFANQASQFKPHVYGLFLQWLFDETPDDRFSSILTRCNLALNSVRG